MGLPRADPADRAVGPEMGRAVGRSVGRAVGIDLGTTYSAVARLNALGRPEILPNREGENITPSVVLFDGERPVVGTMAKRSVVAAPLDVVQFVKRSMGDPAWRFSTSAGTTYRPEEISALILKRLKEDAERALGHEVTEAVITVPAYFDDAPRRATIDAGTIAGFTVRRVLNEPTAAALAYGLDGTVDGTVLVYDLGGGTFDVTVMRISGGEFRVLATHGDRNLGGFDFDNELMRLLNARFMAAGGRDLLDDDVSEADLRERTEIAKHSLTTVDRTRVSLSYGGFGTTIPLTRAEFEDACRGLLGRTRDIAEQVVEEASLSWSELDRVLLVGGATRMPMVRAMLRELSGKDPDLSANPDEVVAHGAAVQASILEGESTGRRGMRVHDVTSQGLGKILYRGSWDAPFNKVIIPRNTPIPARGSARAQTLDPYQTELRNKITQGDDKDPAFVTVVDEHPLPIPVYPHKAPFETTLIYDENQTIHVEIRDIEADRIVGSYAIENIANMSRADAARSAKRLRSIPVD